MKKRIPRRKPALQGAERAATALITFVGESDQFALTVAVFGHPLRRKHWLDEITTALEAKNVHLSHCHLADEGEPRLSEAIQHHLAEVPTRSGHARAVVVTGISHRLPDAAAANDPNLAAPRFLVQVNFDRELFPKLCSHPLILCLNPTSLGLVARHAPDLWQWCSHTFDFDEPCLPDGSHPIRGILELQETQAGDVYANTDELLRAASIFRTGLDAAVAAYGAGHRDTIDARLKLANVLEQLGHYREALDLTRENVSLTEKVPGIPETEVARCIGHHARMLLVTNRLGEAEPLMRRALAIDEASFGEDHLKVAVRLNSLAALLQATNRLGEAEPLMRRALTIFEHSHGKQHPYVAAQLNDLAVLLQATNRLSEAEPLIRRALAIDEASLGKEHPNVATRLNNLAGLLQETNRFGEAEPLMRRALAIFEDCFGREHPNVIAQLNNLAVLLQATNRFGEAEPLMRRALTIDEASFGKEHPKVAIRLNNLAVLLLKTNRFGESEPLMRRNLEILLKFTRDTGHQHPHLLQGIKNYAGLLMAMGDSEDVAVGKVRALVKPYGVSL